MQIGILHTHTTVVILFLVLFLFKALLLFAGKNDLLDSIRAKTKVLDMILGTLILATGAYLMSIVGQRDTWLWVKLFSVVLLIPVSIVGIKKSNKALVALGLVGFLYFYGVAETRSLTMKPTNYAELAASGADETLYSAEVIYANECQRCHGMNGDAEVYKAYNLKTSKLNAQQATDIIRNGRGTMKGYEKRLNDEQINAVAEYIQGFKD